MTDEFTINFFGGVGVFALIFCTPGSEFEGLMRKMLHFAAWTSFLLWTTPPGVSDTVWPYVCANLAMLVYIVLWNMSNGWGPIITQPLPNEFEYRARQYALAAVVVAIVSTLACIVVYEQRTYAIVLWWTLTCVFIREITRTGKAKSN